MFKGVIASDLHLDSHPKRTPTRDFRLQQSFLVIDNIINLAKRNNATDFLWLAGDIVDKQDHDSVTHHVVKECLYRLSGSFKEIYYILGNHDILNRSVSAESREGDHNFSYITLYQPENFIYADRVVIEREGLRIAFRNHTSAAELDLDFLENKPVDILVTHISRAYSEKCEYDVQRYNEDLIRGNVFSGHIHQSRVMGKDVSIGVGQKCTISDDTPKAVVLELNQGKYRFKHELLDPDRKLMDIVPDLEISTDFYDEETNTYHVAKKDEEKILELVASSLRGGSAYETLQKYTESNGIKELFSEIRGATNLDDSGPLDLNFQINAIRIHNLRSIQDQTFEFRPGDFIRIDGETGSGKSTVFLAFQYALTGELGGPKAFFIRHGEKEMWVEIELDYKGKHYKIKRGTSESYLEEDGIRLELGNKNDTKKKIYEILPFVKALGFMCFNRESHIVKGGTSSENSEKLQAFCRIIGLTEIDAYHKTAESMYKPLEQKLITEKAVYESKFSGIEDKQNLFRTLSEKYGDPRTVTAEISVYDSKIKELKDNLVAYQEDQMRRKEFQSLLDQIRAEESRLNDLREQEKNFKSQEEYELQDKMIKEKYSETQSKITALDKDRENYVSLEIKLKSLWDTGNRLNQELSNLKPEEAKYCSSYNVVCPVVTEEMRQVKFAAQKKELQDKLGECSKEYNSLLAEYNGIKPKLIDLPKLQEELQSLTRNQIELNSEISMKKQILEKIGNQEQTLSRLKQTLPGDLGEPVVLIPDLMEKLNSCQSNRNALVDYITLGEELNSISNEFKEIEINVQNLQKKLEDLDTFLKLTKPNGVVYTVILDNIVKSFSNSRYRYEVESNRAKSGIEIRAYIKDSKGNETPYGIGTTGSSSGEGVMIDLHFLSCLVSIAAPGLMIFDEFLSPLDVNLIDEGIQRVADMKANLTFIVAHQNNLKQNFTRVYTCSKENEISRYV